MDKYTRHNRMNRFERMEEADDATGNAEYRLIRRREMQLAQRQAESRWQKLNKATMNTQPGVMVSPVLALILFVIADAITAPEPVMETAAK